MSLRYLGPLLLALLLAGVGDASAQSLIPRSNTRPPDGGDPRNRRPAPPDYRQYEYGKEVYAVKLGCPTCPLGNRPLDEATARRYLIDPELSGGLDYDEQQAVEAYLRKLYNIL